MKIRASSIALALSVIAAPVLAQTPTTSQDAEKDMRSQKQDPLLLQQSSPVDWTMIKGHEKGYITKEEAPANSWLAANFKPCDRNSDSKVTRSEYDQCQRPKKH